MSGSKAKETSYLLPTHLPYLDGLRGVAALIVVVSHGGNMGFWSDMFGVGFGQRGVALFYLLSGFLMAYLYAHKSPNRANIRAYVLSRGTRVLPLYYATLAFAVVAAYGAGIAFFKLEGPIGVAQAVALIHASDVFWSIPVEIHFYGVFVLLWWLMHGRMGIVGTFAVLCVVQLGAIWVAEQVGASIFILPYWMHFFTIGCLVGIWLRRFGARAMNAPASPWLHGAAWLMLPLAGGLMPELRALLGEQVGYPFQDIYSVVYCTLALLAALFALGPFKALGWGPLRWLGAISFSLYLLHMPVLLVFQRFLFQEIAPVGVISTTMMVVVLVVSWLSHRLFEKPVQTGLLIWFKKFDPRSNEVQP